MALHKFHWLGLAYLAAALTGCVSSSQNLAGNPLGLSRNYPIDSPASQNGSKKPNARLHLAYAKLKQSEGDLPEARSSYEQVLAENPKSTDAIVGIARLDQLAGRNDAAEKGLQRALKLEPKSPQILDAMSQFYVAQGRWDDAIRTANEAMLHAPEDKTYRHHLAITLAKSGQVDQSLPHFVQSVGPAAAHYNIGLILHEKGDIKGSEEQFILAVLKNPQLEQAQFWLDEVRRELDPVQLASSNTPKSVERKPEATNPMARQQRPQSGRPAGVQRTANTDAQQMPKITSGQSSASPTITAGPVQQSSQNWPAQNGQTAIASAAQSNSPRASSTVEQYRTSNRAGTALLPESQEIPPSGANQQQWEQWNNQRALMTTAPITSNAGPGGATNVLRR